MKHFLIPILVLIIAGLVNAQDMRQNSFNSLFSDQKASKVGDAVTILVMESSQASNNASTTAGRTSDIGLDASGSAGKTTIPQTSVSLGTKNDFNGSGTTQTSGNIQTKISATVDSVLGNGNLLIKGSRKIVINGEEQTISIKGIVRTSDISPDNSVLSYNISEAEIVFKGNGIISNVQHPGWLTKFFHWIF